MPDILLTIGQAIGVVMLTLVGLLRFTKSKDNGLTTHGWVLLIVGSVIFILTSVVKENETRQTEGRLRQQIEEIRERLFNALALQVMEAPKEITSVPLPKPTGQIRVASPQDGSHVLARDYIEGIVSDPNAKVWVVVHPMEVSAYWVQPAVTVKNDGSWKVMGYLGRSSDIDIGKQFEIMAVANPKVGLKEGDVLSGWPEAQWRSQVISVTRR